METPSSTKRVTRSQARAAALNNNNNIPTSRKIEDSAKNSGCKQQDRPALVDVTNDSPIVGLAMGVLETPSSTSATAKKTISKIKNIINIKTPGSGEALLRGQVKTLLQRVEEEAELSKISLESRPFLRLQGLFLNSSPNPMGLLAPTPANTPMILDDGLTDDNINSTTLPVIQEQLKICEAVVSEMYNGRKLETLESEKSVNRQLLLDFSSEKSESCDSTATTESCSKEEKSASTDDDSASIWSIQVNASTHADEDDDDDYAVIEEEGVEVYDDGNYYSYNNQEEQEEGENYEEEEEGSSGGVLIDELCEGISKISVGFCGKHKTFEYNSDDELVLVGDGVVRLKGLPTPKGKHLRFPEEEEEEE
ncbi:hypothetical protein LINGRAHAP2_LOCUS8195 [Linum grandiflorum]